MRTYGLEAVAGLAMLAVISGGLPTYERRPVRYSKFCGPPHPKNRQQLRALFRDAEKFARAIDQRKAA